MEWLRKRRTGRQKAIKFKPQQVCSVVVSEASAAKFVRGGVAREKKREGPMESDDSRLLA
jgi:hypothetical protein